jgi:hypothetical protein
MADSTIANLTSGSPAVATDVFPIQRGATTLNLKVSDVSPNVSYMWMPHIFPTNITGATFSGVANDVYLSAVNIPFPMLVTNMTIKVTTGVASSAVGFGLYSLSGNVIFKATFATTGTAIMTVALATPVAVPPGTYYWAVSTSALAVSIDVLSSGNTAAYLPTTGTQLFFIASNVSVAGVMPPTLGTLTPQATVNPLRVALLT